MRSFDRRRPLALTLLISAFTPLACSEDKGATDPTAVNPLSLPAFTLTSPVPAAMLQSGTLETAALQVTGQVCDARSPITALSVAGQVIPVTGMQLCVPFDVPVASRWGLTLVTGEATNARGQVAQLARSFLRSPQWYPASAAGVPGEKVKQAIVAELHQAVLDDGVRTPVDDVASLVESALGLVSLDAIVPTLFSGGVPPAPSCPGLPTLGYRVTKRAPLTHGDFTVTQQLDGERLVLTIRLLAASVPIRVDGYLNGCLAGLQTVTANGTVSASSITVTAPFRSDTTQAVPWEIVEEDITISVTGVSIDVDLGAFDIVSSLVSSILSSIANVVNTILPRLVWILMRDVFIGVADNFLDSFDSAPSSDLALPAGGPELGVSEAPDKPVVSESSLKLRKDTEIFPKTARPGADPPRGAIRYAAAVPKLAKPGLEYGVAIRIDLLNKFLWSAWRAGTFDLASLAAAGCGPTPAGLTLHSFATLPPVVMPAPGAMGIEIGIGEVALEGTVDPVAFGGAGAPQPVSLTLSAVFGLHLSVNAATNKLTSAPDAAGTVGVSVQSIGDPSLAAPMRLALGDHLACVARTLAVTIIDAFPVPAIYVGKMPNSPLPPGTKWSPKEPTTGTPAGWVILEGKKQ